MYCHLTRRDIFFLTIGDCQSWYWWIYFSQRIVWHVPVIRAPHGKNSYGQTGPWTPLPFSSLNLVNCQMRNFCVSIFTTRHPFLFVYLSQRVRSFSSWVRAVKASSSERQTEGEKYGAVGATQEACQCPARVLDFGIHLSLSYTLSGTDRSGQRQPVTDD